jgi:hypothetical protein
MVEGESLNQLIEQLQQLHLEQERILQALENIAADQQPRTDIEPIVGVASSTVNAGARSASVPPVATPVSPVAPAVLPTVTVFHIGQCVYITNRITHVPLLRRATEADRTAIVTHFTQSRVAIRTINGYHTHRHPKNLRPL